MNDLLKAVYMIYGMNRTEFSKYSEIPYKTLEGWETKGLTSQGKLLIKAHIALKEQEVGYEQKLEQYKEKAERYEVIKKALDR